MFADEQVCATGCDFVTNFFSRKFSHIGHIGCIGMCAYIR